MWPDCTGEYAVLTSRRAVHDTGAVAQENVLEEATRMIPDTRQRLEGALQDLSNFMVSMSMMQDLTMLCPNIVKVCYTSYIGRPAACSPLAQLYW